MDYPVHLYKVLYPNNALIASQLKPEQFADHYTVGSDKHYNGKVIFAELDPAYRHPYFPIDEALAHVKPHPDGRPKATKFISNYRVLEHIELGAIDKLFIATAQGYVQALEAEEMPPASEDDGLAIYAEISPMTMLILSDLNNRQFGRFITDPGSFQSAPAQFYTKLNVDILGFIEYFKQYPFTNSPISSIHPSALRDAVEELSKYKDKHNKGLCLNSSLSTVSYKQIDRGFTFARGEEMKFFAMPPLDDIEHHNFKFFRNM